MIKVHMIQVADKTHNFQYVFDIEIIVHTLIILLRNID